MWPLSPSATSSVKLANRTTPNRKDTVKTAAIHLLLAANIVLLVVNQNQQSALLQESRDTNDIVRQCAEWVIPVQDNGYGIPGHILELIKYEWTGGDLEARDPHEIIALTQWKRDNPERYWRFIASNH